MTAVVTGPLQYITLETFEVLWIELKFISYKLYIQILGVLQAAWHTKCDDEVSLHFNAFFL